MKKMANLEKKLTVAEYVRVATTKQLDDNLRLKTQEEEIREYCERH